MTSIIGPNPHAVATGGYDKGYDKGFDKGHDKGYDKGASKGGYQGKGLWAASNGAPTRLVAACGGIFQCSIMCQSWGFFLLPGDL